MKKNSQERLITQQQLALDNKIFYKGRKRPGNKQQMQGLEKRSQPTRGPRCQREQSSHMVDEWWRGELSANLLLRCSDA